MSNIKKSSLRKRLPLVTIIFSCLIACVEWLSSYRSIREGVSVADFLLAILLIYFLFETIYLHGKIKVVYVFPIIFLIFLLMISLMNAALIVNFNYIAVFIRYAKFAFFWIIIIFLIPRYLTKIVFYNALQTLAWVAVFGLLIQYIVYFSFGTYIDLKLPFLTYANDIIESIDFQLIRTVEFRPDSIFLEPAHLAVFLSSYLAILLLDQKEFNNNHIKAIIISIFMLMTTSSTSLFLILIIWSFYYLKILFNSKNATKPIKSLFWGFIILGISTPIFINIPQLYQAFERVQDLDGIAITGRLNAGDALVSNLSGIHSWIGVGFGNFNEYQYLNGINYLLYTTGYLGLFFYFILVFIPFLKTNYLGKVMILIFVILAFSRPNVISIGIIVTSAIVYIGYKEKRAALTAKIA